MGTTVIELGRFGSIGRSVKLPPWNQMDEWLQTDEGQIYEDILRKARIREDENRSKEGEGRSVDSPGDMGTS